MKQLGPYIFEFVAQIKLYDGLKLGCNNMGSVLKY